MPMKRGTAMSVGVEAVPNASVDDRVVRFAGTAMAARLCFVLREQLCQDLFCEQECKTNLNLHGPVSMGKAQRAECFGSGRQKY